MKNVTSIFTHVTSPYLPKRGDCIQPPLTYYIPETTGINNYSYYKNLSELNQYAEHLSRISRPFLHSFQSSFRFGNLRNQFFHRTVAFFHIINNRTEIGSPVTYVMAVDEVGFTGRVVCIGYAKSEVAFQTKYFVQKELDIRGSRNALPADFRAVLII